MQRLKLILYSVLVGCLAGSASALFLFTLKLATEFRTEHNSLIYFLPLAGVAMAVFYFRFGKNSEAGSSLIFEEIHDPKNKIPLRMAPLVLLGTLITHLFGGSAGREGTAVQMAASLTDTLAHSLKLNPSDRRALLIAGLGAGFGSAVGAPWAGALFGLEALSIGRLQLFAAVECLVASWVGFIVVGLWGVEHSHYFIPPIPEFSFKVFCVIVLSAMAFGFIAMLFSQFTHAIESLNKKYIPKMWLRPFFAGILVVLGFLALGNWRYAGLGLPVIQNALRGFALTSDPFLKGLFTSLTIGSGFKGGEFIPLVFIGTTLGTLIGMLFSISPGFLAALGFGAVFGAAANTPLACTLMIVEIFGYKFAGYALLACLLSYYSSGHQGIYKKQTVHIKKQDQLFMIFKKLLRGKKHES